MKVNYILISKTFFVCLSLFFIYGCHVPITFQSDPPGARIDYAGAPLSADSGSFTPQPTGFAVYGSAPFTPFVVGYANKSRRAKGIEDKWCYRAVWPENNMRSRVVFLRELYANPKGFVFRPEAALKTSQPLANVEPPLETSQLSMSVESPQTIRYTRPQFRKIESLGITNIGKRWAVVVGVSEYANSGQNGLSNLVYADDDAKAFVNSLKQQGWSDSHIKLLINKQATQRNIMIAIESWLTKAGPDDMVVLFWSGHGFPDPEDPEKVYFACYDTDIRIPATGYRMDKVRSAVEELGCRNVIMFADTCHAGKLITRGDEKAIGIAPYVDSLVKEKDVPKGWIFMVASDVDRKAIEDSSWSHGVFTHCLLKALEGQADGYQSAGSKDGVVTMGELRAFMNSAMPDETQRILGVAKRPMITTSTGDPAIWNLSLTAK